METMLKLARIPKTRAASGALPAPTGSDDSRWARVVSRDPRADGAFVYGVETTGVFCRASCPSRRPRRENVRFFDTPAAARAAGFRACLRCRPDASPADAPGARLAARACELIARDLDSGPPRLKDLARELAAPLDALRRAFHRHTGVTPRRYAEALRMERFKGRLRRRESITPAMYDSGFGSSSRLYERAGRHLGMTPGQYRRGGSGARIRYAVAESALGDLLVAATDVGVCSVSVGESPRALEARLKAEFPGASVERDDTRLKAWLSRVLALAEARVPSAALPLDVRATAFQRRVWEELQRIPRGQTRSYADVAARLGRPRAARAVARACATNPVALIVPCHRVVPRAGGAGGYRWGAQVKQQLLEKETRAAQAAARRPARKVRRGASR